MDSSLPAPLLEAQLRELSSSLACERALRLEAEAAVRTREEMLAVVSHDLRNPLNTIALGAGVLEALAGPRGAAGADSIRRAIGRMHALIQDLLEVNRLVSGGMQVNAVPVDAIALCEEAHAIFGPACGARGHRFELVAERGTSRVMADRKRIAQVFSNLMGNAIKFTPEGGCITLGVHRQGDEAVFAVADSGPGIPAQDLPHVFERFWQAGRPRRGGGVGLGLPIAQGIVHAHGGRIWAESAPGAGTRFCFTLPLAKEA